MWSIGALSFAAPWALAAAVLLPLLWWLLRAVPPAPRRQSFPAIAFLLGLDKSERTAARTPIWLVLLRLVLAALVIGAVAHPLLHARPAGSDRPLLLVIDDGWAAAKGWPQRRALLDTLLGQAERNGVPVILLPTAPPIDGGAVRSTGLLPAGQARGLAEAIEPHPWATDRAAARRALAALPQDRALQVVWLSDGLDEGQGQGLASDLRRLGALRMAVPPPAGLAMLLVPPRPAPDLTPHLRRAEAGQPATVAVRAADAGGRTLARQSMAMTAGQATADLPLPMPTELRNRVARLEIEGEGTSGAVALLDERWQRRPVGLMDEGPAGGASPLLDDLYYAERALATLAELRRGPIAELLKRDLSLAVLPDQGSLSQDQQAALRRWVEGGGVLVRLAGPNLARNPDDLLPVRLRPGGNRTLGGAMSWTRPMAVAGMAENSPLAGLAVPPDLRVSAQVLAEPALDLNDKTWARLEDGTPLVTGAPLGKGWLVLIHTTAWPSWSNLGLSGLFPALLERLLDLSQGVTGAPSDRPLPPTELLDGFARLGPPQGAVESLPPGADVPPSPRHPPGWYGDDGGRRALNLGPAVGTLRPLTVPAGVERLELGGQARQRDLQPPLLMAALALLLIDLLAVLWLRGLLGRRAGMAAAVGLGLLLALPQSGHAQDDMARQAALQTRLAYVVTGDARQDQTSRAGLDTLTQMLAARTTAVLGDPMGVDPARDPLMVFPLLYWPVTAGQGPLTAVARDRVNDFMRHGGMILFDTRDGGQNGPEALQTLTQGLDIPPLTAVTEDHVLTRSFYLLRDLPGRTQGAPVYVAAGGDPANDSVSPVVIGGNDWAGAWAADQRGAPLHPVVPGGEQQREMAYRFGINLVMYALTGSYKADQVHLPAILERLRR